MGEPQQKPAVGRRRVYVEPGRPGAAPAIATLEVEPARADRVPGWLPVLTGRQLAGTACVVCGVELLLDSVRIGAVRQTLAGGRDMVYPVRGCSSRCTTPRRTPRMPQPLGQRPERRG